MADAALTTVINKSVEIGLNLIVEAGSRLYWLPENIKWIERQMRHFNSCLKDAEAKEFQNHEVANLINDMRDLAFDIEDLLDTYLPKIESHKQNGLFRYIKHAVRIPCYGATANTFGLEIEKIKKRVEEIEAKRERCGVTANADPGNLEDEAWQRGKMFLIEKEPIVVGRETTLKKLEEEVLSENSKCKKICVVGVGGVGKTTVVKKLYREVREKFECSAMVYVSMEPKVSELLLQIAKQVGLQSEENLEVNLQSLLEEKRCLILLEDIWDTKAWDDLKGIIPKDSENGSRIIITSRYTDVGRYIGGESSLTQLEPLSPEKSRELFTSLLESDGERFDIKELEDVGTKIIKRCAGLPLAIAVVVGMLRKRKRSRVEWTKVLESMNVGTENDCLHILSLSYKDLPMDLRPLFLYLGVFPEDSKIYIDRIMTAWVAEKLIPLDGTKLSVHVVADQLETLYDRNLIEVTSRTSLDERILSFRIHDVLRSLCIEIAQKSNFFSILNTRPTLNLRRLVLDLTSPTQYHFSEFRAPRLRSLLCFSKVSRGFALLPAEIGSMSSLTYLKLDGPFSFLPSTIWNLKNLQTLDLEDAMFENTPSIPRSFLKRRSLKHFLLPVFSSFQLPSSKSANCLYTGNEVCLPNLETLGWIQGPNVEANILCKLSKLRTLKLRDIESQHLEVIYRTTPVFNKLQELELVYLPNFSKFNLSGYHYLVKLSLTVFVMNNDSSGRVEFPPNLIDLTISIHLLEDDPMRVLKVLPRLETLTLINCASSSYVKLDCSGENSFPQLQVLAIANCQFDELIVDDHGMPKLSKFVYYRLMGPSPSPHQMPGRIRDLMVELYDYIY